MCDRIFCRHDWITLISHDFLFQSQEYWNEVFLNLLNEYQEGLTPNPDVDCNRFIKFGHFHRYCLEQIGCNAVATGHYARSTFGDFLEHHDINRRVKLLMAMDRIKDQTLFLSQIPQEALRNTMFPIGSLTKGTLYNFYTKSSNSKLPQVSLYFFRRC